MRRLVVLVYLVLVFAVAAAAQGDVAKLRVRAVLVDKDLNQKPVPRLVVVIRGLAPPAEPQSVKTGFDGQVEVALAPGSYQITTPEPVELQGKRYTWELDFTLERTGLQLDLSNDNAKVSEAPSAPAARPAEDLSSLFKRLQHSVVTVWSSTGRGTGFIVDDHGLVITNQHVVAKSDYFAVQFDDKHKVSARLLASDAEKDVAVLWANLAAASNLVVAPMIDKGAEAPVAVGERVFTIGNPLSQDKVLTTGVVSKIEDRIIISDININPGNSGGPLFNSAGHVVGITTYGEQANRGPGLSGIVRIEQALPLLTDARSKASGEAPPPTLLPVDPIDKIPVDMLRAVLAGGKLETALYFFAIGEFEVALYTPVLDYHFDREREKAVAKEREKRKKKSGAATDEKQEREPEYKPYLLIRARPKLRVKASSLFLPGPAKYRFKTDFQRMRLLCDGKEVTPIHPLRVEAIVDIEGSTVQAVDKTVVGLYRFTPDAISPSCSQMSLEVFSEAPDQPPLVKVLDPRTVARIWADFEPYRRSLPQAKPAEEKPNE